MSKALDALLVGLSDVAKKASEELGPGATEQQIVDRTIKLLPGADGGRGLGHGKGSFFDVEYVLFLYPCSIYPL